MVVDCSLLKRFSSVVNFIDIHTVIAIFVFVEINDDDVLLEAIAWTWEIQMTVDTTVMEAGALQWVVLAAEQQLMKLYSSTTLCGVSHASTRLGQFRQLLTATVDLDLGWVSHVGMPMDGLATHHDTVVAVILHSSCRRQTQNTVQSMSALASQQALLENMAFHRGDQFTDI